MHSSFFFGQSDRSFFFHFEAKHTKFVYSCDSFFSISRKLSNGFHFIRKPRVLTRLVKLDTWSENTNRFQFKYAAIHNHFHIQENFFTSDFFVRYEKKNIKKWYSHYTSALLNVVYANSINVTNFVHFGHSHNKNIFPWLECSSALNSQ